VRPRHAGEASAGSQKLNLASIKRLDLSSRSKIGRPVALEDAIDRKQARPVLITRYQRVADQHYDLEENPGATGRAIL
jgi:hypothetical protein